MNYKDYSRKLYLVIYLSIIVVMQGCQNDFNIDEYGEIYSEKKDFILPKEISEKLSDSELSIINKINKNFDIFLIDSLKSKNLKLKKINKYDELECIVEQIGLKCYDDKNIKIVEKNVKYGVQSVKTIHLHLASFTNSVTNNTIMGHVYLIWQYLYDDESHLAIGMGDSKVETVSEPGYLHGAFTFFDGLHSVFLDKNKIEFHYSVEGNVCLGISVGGASIGVKCFRLEKNGHYLCPLD